jgi:two-component SAPR family response regulator
MSGPELAAQVLALQPEIKLIYMSGYSEFTAFPKGETDPDTVSLQKPFTRDALVRAVRDVLDGGAKPNGGQGVRLTMES